MRGRFKTTRVCSSDNYTLSKKLHMSMLEENHDAIKAVEILGNRVKNLFD